MEPAAEVTTARWWPRIRPIDVLGIVLVVALITWAWLVARVQDADAGPMVSLLLASAIVAALARWATFFHATGAPAIIVAGVVGYVIATGDDLSVGLGPDGSAEAAGAVLAVGTGAAAIVTVRARSWWPRGLAGFVALGLGLLTGRTGSVLATVLAVIVLVSTATLLALPMRERRWVVAWPAFVAVLVLFGSLTYAALPLPSGALLDAVAPERVAAWTAGLDVVTDSPLYGTGPGVVDADVVAADGQGWASHEPLEVMAETGVLGGFLLLGLLWWLLAWVARPGGGHGSVVAGVVIAGSIAHACLEPIWHVPAVPLLLAALAGVASLPGGDAAWRLEALLERAAPRPETEAVTATGDRDDATHRDDAADRDDAPDHDAADQDSGDGTGAPDDDADPTRTGSATEAP